MRVLDACARVKARLFFETFFLIEWEFFLFLIFLIANTRTRKFVEQVSNFLLVEKVRHPFVTRKQNHIRLPPIAHYLVVKLIHFCFRASRRF